MKRPTKIIADYLPREAQNNKEAYRAGKGLIGSRSSSAATIAATDAVIAKMQADYFASVTPAEHETARALTEADAALWVASKPHLAHLTAADVLAHDRLRIEAARYKIGMTQ